MNTSISSIRSTNKYQNSHRFHLKYPPERHYSSIDNGCSKDETDELNDKDDSKENGYSSENVNSLLHITPRFLTRKEFERLHRLSALIPPEKGSKEEAILLKELSGLLGLMDLVKDVDMEFKDDEERERMIRDLLSDTGTEVVIDGTGGEVS
ncbi:hypothetical protein TREMEDRAFT_58581 [Tremella mesenterica DSM 1558]|uniref:uncharacterized protein n=1 Tax=Tremella mesenterica (strain ATCC 24925 / CBS 8224 / DSM 1558 / NBRC 9311 / NRRL Y-6157 / RJB 2259-6 / UBC 559-6) TaxID=578456 RepID=UPI0003F492E7|nr:uncharacterized protein TREMEDRAFT_58581 [Tremella mesenterica DSM 1558]EIW72418.1 hypothetical protein TREMEDRAFT_58581 [Tremella mesenterica DSM 1558]